MNGLHFIRTALTASTLIASMGVASADTIKLEPTTMPEWKAVYGRVEARDTVPARARIGGTIVTLDVTEGDEVKAGQQIATVKDDKLDFQIAAIDAQLAGLRASLANAKSELARGEELAKRGVTSAQSLDSLRTQVDVIANQIGTAEAQRAVISEQNREGAVLAPSDGKVLTVPVTRNGVVLAGETIATIGGGGIYLRLAIPERHATLLNRNDGLEIDRGDGTLTTGQLTKIYPEIENGRVIADVEVDDLPTDFIERRLLVHVPVGTREALLLPQSALTRRYGVDYVGIQNGDAVVDRAVVASKPELIDGKAMIEVLTGLAAGDEVVIP